jgi:hypothetical protein
MIRAATSLGKLRNSASQDLQNLFKFHAYLLDYLLTLCHVRLGIVARKALTRPADRKALVVQQTADLPNNQHILTLVIAAIASTLYRL